MLDQLGSACIENLENTELYGEHIDAGNTSFAAIFFLA